MRYLGPLLLSLAIVHSAHAAAIFKESWSNPGDKEGWETSPAGAASGGALWFGKTTAGLDIVSVQATGSASGGAFVGDYLAAGAEYIEFDISEVSGTGAAIDYNLILYTSGGDGIGYWTGFAGPSAGGFSPFGGHSQVALQKESWYVLQNPSGVDSPFSLTPATDAFYSAVQSVQKVSLDYYISGTFSATLDNFELTPAAVPEPSTFVVFGVGTIGCVACTWRRRRQAA